MRALLRRLLMTQPATLPLHRLPGPVGCFEPRQEFTAQVSDSSPALLVMTDLRQQVAFSIEPNASVDRALQRMKTVGVRLLFVVNPEKDVVGLITSTDILGEKPLKFRQELQLRHDEVMVRDIMTPQAQLEALNMGDVLRASVGDIVATLRSVGRRHALVLDEDPGNGRPAIRGIFSASQIGKQLGYVIETPEIANTFAQVEVALNNQAGAGIS